MTYADLIQQRLQTLSPAQQAEVFDFVEFLASRRAAAAVAPPTADASLAERLPMWLDEPGGGQCPVMNLSTPTSGSMH